MPQEKPDDKSKYFRSFIGLQHPVEPVGVIEFSEARRLSTYYEARYDDRGRLVKFIKHLQIEQTDDAKWVVMFTEEYSYWDSGCIRKRRLILPDQPDQIWTFKDHERRWSRYFDDICARWFSRASDSIEPTLTEKALLVHEQFTELEISVFASAPGVTEGDQWAFESAVRAMEQIRQIIIEIGPDASPRICAVALGHEEPLSLDGFDDPPPSLFGVVDDWLEKNEVRLESDIVTVLPREGFDAEGQAWARGSDVASITVAPVYVVINGQPVEVFTLILLTALEPDDREIALMNSVFRRVVLLLQHIIERAGFATQQRDWSKNGL